MSKDKTTIQDRLEEILESITLIEEWSANILSGHDFMISSNNVMAFNACVMRMQVIGEQVGRLLKEKSQPLAKYDNIPWLAIYDMRNFISHEYANIDEDVVFSTIKDDLPKLKKVVEELLVEC